MKPRNWDYYLIILTTLILFAIGIVCLYSITLYNYLSVNSQWTLTAQYSQYVEDMNSYLYPFLILLLLSLGLCIPKRLFEQENLLKSGAFLLGVTVLLTYLSGIGTGLLFLLVIITIVQGFVLAMTIGSSRNLRFEKEGYFVRIGSSLVHLGLVVLILDFVSLQENSFHIAIFWFGTMLVTAGNFLSFYAEKIMGK